jgi:hypothetical protein
MLASHSVAEDCIIWARNWIVTELVIGVKYGVAASVQEREIEVTLYRV